MVVHAYNPSIEEAEAREYQVQDQPGLYIKPWEEGREKGCENVTMQLVHGKIWKIIINSKNVHNILYYFLRLPKQSTTGRVDVLNNQNLFLKILQAKVQN